MLSLIAFIVNQARGDKSKKQGAPAPTGNLMQVGDHLLGRGYQPLHPLPSPYLRQCLTYIGLKMIRAAVIFFLKILLSQHFKGRIFYVKLSF
jgi:hypothetical protein